jgi:orotate phosphoribosyltransferase
MQGNTRELADRLLAIGAIKFGKFKLKLHEKNPDAPLSPIYVDLRLVRSDPKAFHAAIEVYQALLEPLRFDLIADVPTAATPFASVLSYTLRIPLVSPRRDEKSHGLSQTIDGLFHPGQVVILLDDLITQADSKVETIHVLEHAGLKVRDVAVLVDREQGGVAKLADAGYSCHVAVRLTELLEYYRESGLISGDEYAVTMSYLGFR